jgi:hypothetical protein
MKIETAGFAETVVPIYQTTTSPEDHNLELMNFKIIFENFRIVDMYYIWLTKRII